MADNAYITALRWSLSRYQAELLELRTLGQRALIHLEYRAAERTLQVSIEACIGVAKHWAKGWRATVRRMPIRRSRSWVQRPIRRGVDGWRKIIGPA